MTTIGTTRPLGSRARVAMRLLVVALVAVAGSAVGAGRLAAASSAPGSRIVFAANDAPRWYGEIYRVTSNGKRIDLSRSPAPDLAPSVSPDGKWVAFLSGRGGAWAFYVVGSDGRGLHRISPPLSPTIDGADAAIAWAPNSRDLAAELSGVRGAVYLGSRDGRVRLLGQDIAVSSGSPALSWSPDGRMLAYSTNEQRVQVVSATGTRLWSRVGSVGAHAWSADDRLAAITSVGEQIATVYDGRGRRLAAFPAGGPPAWSPDGKLLASSNRFAVQLRRDGVGAPILRWPAHNAVDPQWSSSTKLRYLGQTGWVGIDVAHDRRWSLVDPATPYNSVVSASGQVLAEQAAPNTPSKLVLSAPRSSRTTTLATGPWCPDEGDFAALAFMPRTLGAIYQTSCATPSADIYSIDPDGSGLRQITHTPEDELDPSLSPDGRNVVYVQQLSAGKCDGCPQTLWRIPRAGGSPQQLTQHAEQDTTPFDINPTWSPDGSEIAFQNSGAGGPIRLLEMPATGGATHDLMANGAAVPSWGPKLIAYADWSVAHLVVKTVDPSTGAVATVATGGDTDVEALAWSNGARLAYLYIDQNDDHTLVAIAGSKAKPLDLSAHLPAHARVAGLAWSPDGTRFAFAATDVNGTGEIYTIATDGSGLRQLTKNIGAPTIVGYESTLSWR
jgi:Tol biopolymer transport system component